MQIDSVLKAHGIDSSGGGGGNVKSIQRGTLALSLNEPLITTVAITTVDIEKAVVFFTFTGSGNPGARYLLTGNMQNSNTIFFQRALVDFLTTVEWVVVEFGDTVKSVQRGAVNQVDGQLTYNLNISTVDMNKTLPLVTSWGASPANYLGIALYTAKVTTSTNLQLIRANGYTVGTIPINWQVVEFN